MASTVGEKGQVVIEKPIRDALGVRPGFVAVQSLRDDRVEIRFYPPEHNRSLKGALAEFVECSIPPEEWEQARQDAWSEAVKLRKSES